jgi:hypothetical protein
MRVRLNRAIRVAVAVLVALEVIYLVAVNALFAQPAPPKAPPAGTVQR